MLRQRAVHLGCRAQLASRGHRCWRAQRAVAARCQKVEDAKGAKDESTDGCVTRIASGLVQLAKHAATACDAFDVSL